MKFKKLVALTASVACVGALAACGGEFVDTVVDRDYNLSEPGELMDGFISLANQNANEEVKTDGHYVAGGKTFWTKNTFRTTYSTEPDGSFFNYLKNTWTYNSYHYTNMVDGLVENDKYGNIVGALAIGYQCIDNPSDGTQTWRFQLRKNAEWVDNETGKFYAKVTANDFVTSAKYVLDPANGAGASAMYTNFIAGAKSYMTQLGAYESGAEGATLPDFDDVGIKATDEYVIEYTTNDVYPFFITCLTYSPYLPVNAEFLAARGTDFGKTVNDILVNGAFRITEHTFEVRMGYSKNYHYYDRGHVYFDYVIRTFVPGTATLDTTRIWFENGTIDSFSVNHDDEDGWEKYVIGPDGTGSLKAPANELCNSIQAYDSATYIGYWNFNRTTANGLFEYHQYPSSGTGAAAISCDSNKTDDQKKQTIEALLNVNFRLGFLYGLDVLEYLKRFDAEEPENFLMRGFTNKELDSAAGKDYTDYVNDAFNAHTGRTGEDEVSLIGIDNGGDPIYDPELAKTYFQAAYDELTAAGMPSSAFPIKIDYIGSMRVQLQAYETVMLSHLQVNSVLENGTQVVKINYNVPADSTENTKWGSTYMNYDFSLWSGWGPDYADPNTYLHCWTIYGDMMEYNGFPTNSADLAEWELSEFAPQKYQDLVVEDNASAAVAAFMNDTHGAYAAEYEAAAAIVDPARKAERFAAFAEAEYSLIYEYGLIVPWLSQNGYTASVSNTVPWQAGRATYGLTGDKFKNVVVTNSTITQEVRAAVTAEYEAGK